MRVSGFIFLSRGKQKPEAENWVTDDGECWYGSFQEFNYSKMTTAVNLGLNKNYLAQTHFHSLPRVQCSCPQVGKCTVLVLDLVSVAPPWFEGLFSSFARSGRAQIKYPPEAGRTEIHPSVTFPFLPEFLIVH